MKRKTRILTSIGIPVLTLATAINLASYLHTRERLNFGYAPNRIEEDVQGKHRKKFDYRLGELNFVEKSFNTISKPGRELAYYLHQE